MISPIIKRYGMLIKSVETRIHSIARARSKVERLNDQTINTRRRRLVREASVLDDELASLTSARDKFVENLNEAREC